MALKDPDGNFVKTSSNEMAYTQRIDTIPSRETNEQENKEEPKEEKKKNKFFAKHPALKILLIILIIILIPVGVFFGTQAALNAGSVKDVQLPNFVNMTREEAETAATEANVQLEVSEEFNSDVEEGKIISQDPPYMENYTVKENSVVKVVVSKGENIKIVPNVVGKEQSEAELEIKAEELKVEVVQEASSRIEAGYVIRQEPEADEEVNAGETVKIYVSTGIKQITMEHVIGQTEEDAKKTLTDLGFEVTVVYEEDTSKDDGVVLKQSIDVGTTVDEGTKVTLTVNKVEALKEGTVNVNVKSLIGNTTQPDVNQVDQVVNTVNVRITVTSEGVEEPVYDEACSVEETNLSIQVSGRGTITVKVFVDGVRKDQRTLDLNSENPVLNID